MLSPLELATLIRTYHGTRAERLAAADDAKSDAHLTTLLQKLGLSPDQGPFWDLAFDPYRQIPYEPMHLEKLGFCKKFLSCFASSLKVTALDALNARIRKFPIVPPWNNALARLDLTTGGKQSHKKVKVKSATETGRLCSVLGLLLRGWIEERHFMGSAVTHLKMRVGDEWLSEVLTVVYNVARSTCWVLATHHPMAEWQGPELHNVVKAGREGCVRLWPARFVTPTVHAGSHASDFRHEQVCTRNANTAKPETKHKELAQTMTSYNGKNAPEEHMMMKNNLKQCTLFIIHGGAQHLQSHLKPGPDYIRVVKGPVVTTMLSRAGSIRNYVGLQREEDNDVASTESSDLDSESDPDRDSGLTSEDCKEGGRLEGRLQGPESEASRKNLKVRLCS